MFENRAFVSSGRRSAFTAQLDCRTKPRPIGSPHYHFTSTTPPLYSGAYRSNDLCYAVSLAIRIAREFGKIAASTTLFYPTFGHNSTSYQGLIAVFETGRYCTRKHISTLVQPAITTSKRPCYPVPKHDTTPVEEVIAASRKLCNAKRKHKQQRSLG